MIPALAGPVVLIATAVFGTPAALLVRKFSIGRWMSLVVILGFACLPMLLAMFWAGNWEMDSLPQAGRGLLISGLFAVPAALSLWRGLTGKRQQADAPTIS